MFGFKKILSAEQTRKADAYTIAHESISSINLMERAATAFFEAVLEKLHTGDKICIVCGTGNNGGDGFVIARLLQTYRFEVEIFLVKFSEKLSPDCEHNFKKLSKVNSIKSLADIPNFEYYDIIIDAIFGAGLSRAPEGMAAAVIQSINHSEAKVFSVDLPSGMFCDNVSVGENIVQADYCISFQRPKLAFFFPTNVDYIKEWQVVDIGLDEKYIQSIDSQYFILNNNIEQLVNTRQRQSHKGTYGHALIMAGSYGKIGAAVLSSRACLRGGAGLLTTYVPSCGYTILQTTIPEAMCLTDTNISFITELPEIKSFNAIGVGPGIGTNQQTVDVIKKLFTTIAKQSLVLDADALNILSARPDLLNELPQNAILTPHPKEFERLVGKWKNDEDRLNKLKNFCAAHQSIVVLKDVHTIICTPTGGLFFNTTGNAGMATGGSGDVLTGIITGLLAQHYEPLQAALLAVYFHGKAGDHAKYIKGENALIASDIIENLRIEKAT